MKKVLFLLLFILLYAGSTSKIINGFNATLFNPFKGVVEVVISEDNNYYGLCGGVLINKDWVLTAAHCVENINEFDKIKVYYGSLNLFIDNPNYRDVKNIIIHEGYNGLDNDIALIELNNSINDYTVATLGNDDKLYEAFTPGYVVGWGITENGTLSNVLKFTLVPIVSQSLCINSYGSVITSNMFCAGFPNGGVDSCQGDSGGPFYVKNNENFIVVGLVSWGNGCAQPNYYGVYTKINNYIDWIKRYTTINEYTSKIYLSPGWSLLGTSHSVDFSTLINMLNCVNKIYIFDNNEYKLFNNTTQQFTIIPPNKGFWVYTYRDCYVEY